MGNRFDAGCPYRAFGDLHTASIMQGFLMQAAFDHTGPL